MPNYAPGWIKLSRLPRHVVQCPRCKSAQSHKEHNWRWDEEAGSWLCTRYVCMTPRKPVRVTASQRMYAPIPQ